MEYRIVVVSIETELQKISGGEGSLFRKEFELNIAGGCLEEDFSSRLGFEVVNGAHDVRDVWRCICGVELFPGDLLTAHVSAE